MPTKQGNRTCPDASCSPEECIRLAERSQHGDMRAFEVLLYHARPKIRGHVCDTLKPYKRYWDDLISKGEELLWSEVLRHFRPDLAGGGGFGAYASRILKARLADELVKLIHDFPIDRTSYRKLNAAYERVLQNRECPTAETLHRETACHLDTCYKFLFNKLKPRQLFESSGAEGPRGTSGTGEDEDAPLPDTMTDSGDGDVGDPADGPGMPPPDHHDGDTRQLVVGFVLDEWLPLENPRMAPILENELSSFDQAGRTDADLAEEFSCTQSTVRSDKATALAWLAIAAEFICHLSSCSSEEAYGRLKSWIDGVSSEEIEDEPRVDKLLRRFRERRKLKNADIARMHELLDEYRERRWRDGTHENA